MKSVKVKYRVCPLCAKDEIKILNSVNNIDIVRCSACKMVFADVDNAEIEDKNIYTEESFYKYISNEPVYSLAYYDLILDKITKCIRKKDIKILEFGCGPGFFLSRAKFKGMNAEGCDISSYSQLAKEKFDLHIKTVNILDSDYADEDFDVVISHATHEHLSNMFELSQKLHQLLKPGGLFIISGVPNYNTVPIKLFGNFFKNSPPSHVNFFEKRSLKRFYKRLKMNPIFVRTYGMSTWVWYILLKIKQKTRKRKKREEIKSEPQNVTNMKGYDIKGRDINGIHKLIALIYVYFHIPGMGRNLEIWGRKKL